MKTNFAYTLTFPLPAGEADYLSPKDLGNRVRGCKPQRLKPLTLTLSRWERG
jgi:hypothetical protein